MTLYPVGNNEHRTYPGDRGIKLGEAKKHKQNLDFLGCTPFSLT